MFCHATKQHENVFQFFLKSIHYLFQVQAMLSHDGQDIRPEVNTQV